MFINNALAASVPVMEDSSTAGTLIQLALILLIFYFLLIRPQQKRMREHAAMINSLKVGDKVLTNGGIYGRITKISDLQILLEISSGVEIEVDRMSVSAIIDENKIKENKTISKKKQSKGN